MQIYDLLKGRIESGFYPPGSQLPKEVDLAVELGVSRVTLRPALELLELERLVRREKGFGTFVRNTEIGRTRLLVIVSCNDPSQTDYASNPFPYIMPCLQLEADRMNTSLETCDCHSLLTLDSKQCAARIAERGIQGIIWMDNNFTGREPLLEPVRKTGRTDDRYGMDPEKKHPVSTSAPCAGMPEFMSIRIRTTNFSPTGVIS